MKTDSRPQKPPVAAPQLEEPTVESRLTPLIAQVASELRELRTFFENQATDGQARPLTEEQAAAYCRVEIKTLRYYSHRLQEIPFIKVGRRRLYLREDLDRFLHANRVGTVRKVR